MIVRLLILLFFVIGTTAGAWAEQPKKVIIDGVEYVPKSQTRATNSDKRTSESRIVKIGAGDERGGSLENFSMKGKYGLGLSLGALNFGLGPSGEYWFTDNIAALASYSALGDFTTIEVKGNYLFDKEFKFDQSPYPFKPYAGVGFATAEGPINSEAKGFQIFAGLFHPAPYFHKNIATRLEFSYSTLIFETEVERFDGFDMFGNIITKKEKEEVGDFSGFDIGLGVTYYFN